MEDNTNPGGRDFGRDTRALFDALRADGDQTLKVLAARTGLSEGWAKELLVVAQLAGAVGKVGRHWRLYQRQTEKG